MKHQHLTWYLLVDGTHADPNDVAPGDDGVLRHKNGLAVALHADGTPQTIGRGAVENKNVEAAEAGESELAEPDVPDPKADNVPGALQTEVDPATGESPPAEVRPMTTDDLKPKPVPAKVPDLKKALAPKNDPAPPKADRQMKPAKNRAKYKTR